MGTFLNPGSGNFKRSLHSEIYVDKSNLIAFTNQMLGTEQCYLCVSRPRRFGKTMAAHMLAAYYDCSEDTSSLFDHLNIAQDKSYLAHRNQYHVIKWDMQFFMTSTETISDMLSLLHTALVQDIQKAYPSILLGDEPRLPLVLSQVYQETGRQFVFLIDEWDCVMRRIPVWEEQRLYLDFLRNLLKDQPYVALAYMTGILPIKKYGEHSTLNMFSEYSMLQSHKLTPYFGFTEEEVRTLCNKYDMDFATTQDWYDGYRFVMGREGQEKVISIYSPRSVVMAMLNEAYASYWTYTETYTALKTYIQMNYDGLRDAVVQMLAGKPVHISTRHFQNDMTTFQDKDDIFTLLVHLGYLSYNSLDQTVVIPNKEVGKEFVDSIARIDDFKEVSQSIQTSRKLLQDLWNGESEAVAAGVEKAHMHFPSIQYNNENALSCVIELAFYYAREYYTIIRELPAGVGYADICYIPKPKHSNKPAIIVELKWEKNVETAIDQIKRKKYPEALAAYQGNLLLCGISYNRDAKAGEKCHTCVLEKYVK